MEFTSIDLIPNSAPHDHNMYKRAAAHCSLCATSGQRSPALEPKAGDHIAHGHVDPTESHTHCVSSERSGCSDFFPREKPRDRDETAGRAFCKPSLCPLQPPRGLSPVLHTDSSILCDPDLKWPLRHQRPALLSP